MARSTLRVIPLGGLGEIGRNMLILEWDGDCLAVDAGVMFPEEEMLGVDLVIPDITYLLERKRSLRGIVITHGHEDHIGALPYLLPQLECPVYATPLAHALIEVKLQEHGIKRQALLHRVQIGDRVQLGPFEVEWFRVTHSIPDAAGLGIRTPLGLVVHTGDFKIDHTPVDGKAMDLNRIAQLGQEGVVLLCSDSTYSERAGYTPSEQVVADNIDRIIGEAEGRVIVASFASLISRIQIVLDAAAKYGRRVFVFGRSMVDNVEMAVKMGYLRLEPGILGSVEELRRAPPAQTIIMATGSQGEPTSALARIASNDHRTIRIMRGDTVIVSASPIPGNDRLVAHTLDNLFQQGARVFYSRVAEVHVPGHGGQEEMKLIMALTRPRYFVPVHGEYRHLVHHAGLAQSMGLPPERTFVLRDGDVLELSEESGRVVENIPASYVYVDGFGGIGDEVLRDRQHLSRDGVLVVIIPFDKMSGRLVAPLDMLSRGFVEANAAGLIDEAKAIVAKSLDSGAHPVEINVMQSNVRQVLGRFLWERTRRRPMILPVVVEL